MFNTAPKTAAAATDGDVNKSKRTVISQTGSKGETVLAIAEKHVHFNERVLVYTLPRKTAEAQWLARFGVWKPAPFHDELWDGYTLSFRPKILTKKQLANVNVEYKWRRRMPSKVFALLFERGAAKGRIKLARSKDEVQMLAERKQKVEEANQKLLGKHPKEKLSVASDAVVSQKEKSKKHSITVSSGAKEKPKINGNNEEINSGKSIGNTPSSRSLFSRLSRSGKDVVAEKESDKASINKIPSKESKSPKIDPDNDRESDADNDISDGDIVVPRSHSFEELLNTNPSDSHNLVQQNSKMTQDKHTVLQSFEEYEESKRRGSTENAPGRKKSTSSLFRKRKSSKNSTEAVVIPQNVLTTGPVIMQAEVTPDTPAPGPSGSYTEDFLNGVMSLRTALASFFYTEQAERPGDRPSVQPTIEDEDEDSLLGLHIEDDIEMMDGLHLLDGIKADSLVRIAKEIKNDTGEENEAPEDVRTRRAQSWYQMFDKLYSYGAAAAETARSYSYNENPKATNSLPVSHNEPENDVRGPTEEDLELAKAQVQAQADIVLNRTPPPRKKTGGSTPDFSDPVEDV